MPADVEWRRCPGCRELVRPEDDFAQDDSRRFWHIDCWED